MKLALDGCTRNTLERISILTLGKSKYHEMQFRKCFKVLKCLYSGNSGRTKREIQVYKGISMFISRLSNIESVKE